MCISSQWQHIKVNCELFEQSANQIGIRTRSPLIAIFHSLHTLCNFPEIN